MSDQTHPFDAAVALEPLGDNRWRGATSSAYANIVGPFGGVTAAAALQAVLRHPQRQGDPVAFTANFTAPLADGGFDVVALPVRTNRSTQHWTVEIRQQDAVVLTATAVLAARRQTWSTHDATMPVMPRPETLPRAPAVERARWTSRYEMRFVRGALPELGGVTGAGGDAGAEPAVGGASESLLWVRDDPPRALDFASLTALADVFFPRIFHVRASWVPIGTVSMSVYYHADAALLAATGDARLVAAARAQRFRNGYFDQSGEIWRDDGELLAVTHQIVYYRE